MRVALVVPGGIDPSGRIRVIPAFLANGERAQALLAAVQVLVLLAASLNLFPAAP